ncbi:MAG: hypothetical protein QOG38_2651 [Hyphomicrobiales bacterium]|jgi:hypothetical protein|nr:hypothetical protein [Hyphomicrobiales bacterium]
MPPVILWMVGAIGAIAGGRWLMREARRINAELHPDPSPARADERAAARKLERDPQTGVYRPK